MLVLQANYSDIFDEIYIANKSGNKITVDITEPVLNDIREVFSDVVKKQNKKEDNL